jgi:hemerythrin-like domain-containing protein
MQGIPSIETGIDFEHPLVVFAGDHKTIVEQLGTLSWLPQLTRAASRARQVAEKTLALFDEQVDRHHREEETELFPAVLRSAQKGEEAAQVQAHIDRLTVEHSGIEAQWHRLAPQLRKVAAGKDVEMDTDEVDQLVEAYLAHARFEEEVFLPLADKILARNGNHMSALGLSLHMGRVPLPSPRI